MTPTAAQPTVLYIASTPRAGSTLLDSLLGNHSQVHPVGEMRWLKNTGDPPIPCSCGVPVAECPFWTDVQARCGQDFQNGRLWHISPKWRQLIAGGAWSLLGPQAAREVNRALLAEGVEVAHNCFRLYDTLGPLLDVPYIADSSKRIGHFVYLYLLHPERMRLIHLVRDGRAVVYSATRGERVERWRDPRLSPVAQAARQWVQLNQATLSISRRLPACQKFFLRYEDLCADPQAALARIYAHFGLVPAEHSASIRAADFHLIGGSPTLKTNAIKLDTAWQQQLSAEQLADFERVGGKLNRQLGYT